jgi:hypothetical protein
VIIRELFPASVLVAAVVSGAVLQAGQQGTGATASQPGSPIDYATARLQRVAHAVRVSGHITVDGRLDEAAWGTADPAGNFIQWEPHPEAPASDRTEVRFLYDAENLYIGAQCWDASPHALTVHELKQDFESREEDVLAIFIDSLHDHESGFSFWTNPAGARRDVQIFQDDAQRSVDWDGVWTVKVTTSDVGWTAEFVIPFKTFRFSSRPQQEWGLNILRRVKRKNEDSYWSPLPRRYRTMRPSMSGTLTGLENIKQGRNLKIKPYAISSVTEQAATGLVRDLGADAGLDVKYGLTASQTLDLTYRTDFSQVEADQQQVNLTRFNVLFPEKREFFLENSGVFGTTAGSAAIGGGGTNIFPFFSRRIGLSAAGTPIPILGGARVSGTTGPYDVGFLTMKTERQGDTLSNGFLVGRIRRNFKGSSSVGAIVTSRDSTRSGDYNRLYGIDTLMRFFQRKLDVSGYVLTTDTPGRTGPGQARLIDAVWRDDAFSIGARYDTVQPDFNPEVGFVRRLNTTHYAGEGSWQPRPRRTTLVRNFDFGAGADLYQDPAGTIETREQTVSAGIAFQNSSALTLNATSTFDRLEEPFPIQRGIIIPVGDYDYRRASVSYSSNRGRAVSGNVTAGGGQFWDGRSWSADGGFEFRPNYHVDLNLTFSRNQVKLPAGDFTTTLLGLRALYAFTSNAFLNSFVQYNATTNELSANTRFNIIHRPLSDLYVVYNERRNSVSGALLARGLTVKFTNLFDF